MRRWSTAGITPAQVATAIAPPATATTAHEAARSSDHEERFMLAGRSFSSMSVSASSLDQRDKRDTAEYAAFFICTHEAVVYVGERNWRTEV